MRNYIFAVLLFFSYLSISAQNWIWGKQATNTPSSLGEGNSAASDKNGNVFITGWFENNMYFNATSLNTPSGSIDVFLAKYNSLDSLLWVIQSTTPSLSSLCLATGVAVDFLGNSFITGNYKDTAVFGTHMVKDVTPPFTMDGMFLTKVSQNGTIIWVRQSKAANSTCGGNISAVATDNTGNIYITGHFINKVSFGSDTLNTSGTGCFVVKYDSAGNVIWAKQSTANVLASGSAINVNKHGDVFVTGYFYNTVTFGTQTLNTLNTYDMFIIKYNSVGTLIWAKQANVASANCQIEGLGITTDKSGNPYVSGYFYDSASIGLHNLYTAQKDTDVFVAKYDSNGSLAWVLTANNKDNNDWLGYSICSDTLGHLFFSCGGYGAKEKNPNCELIIGTDTFSTSNPGFDDASIIAMIDTTGKVICGSITPSVGDDRNVVACDPTGRYIYLSGDLGTNATFGPDVLTYNYSESPVVARWQSCIETGMNLYPNINQGIKIFPNPNNGIFTIEISETTLKQGSQVEVYNLLGEKISVCKLSAKETSVKLINKPAGIYFYRIFSAQNTLSSEGKFIIQY